MNEILSLYNDRPTHPVVVPEKTSFWGKLFSSKKNSPSVSVLTNKTITVFKKTLESFDQSIVRLYWLDLVAKATGEQLTVIALPTSRELIPIERRITEIAGENWLEDLRASINPTQTVTRKQHMIVNPSNSNLNHAIYFTTDRHETRTYSPLSIVGFSGSSLAYNKVKVDLNTIREISSNRHLITRKIFQENLTGDFGPRINEGMRACYKAIKDYDQILQIKRDETARLSLSPEKINLANEIAQRARQKLNKESSLRDYRELLVSLEDENDSDLDLIHCIARQVIADMG